MWRWANLRVLVDELGAVIDDIVDDQEAVLLGVVLGNILISELLRHLDKSFGGFLTSEGDGGRPKQSRWW